MKNPKNIVITGASSGLGRALALHYAAAGTTLYLHGRDPQRLNQVALECTAMGANVHLQLGEVADVEAMNNWLLAIDTKTPLDLIIANAGVSAGLGKGGETAAQARKIFSTNMDGMLNTVMPLLPKMIARKHGQIAMMASLAGLRGLPSSPAYSASKGWARIYGEGLRGWVGKHGVEVNVICPGYIKTAMTAVNDFPMPGIMEADKAARIIARGLAKNRARIAFPRRLYWPAWILACLPVAWTDPLFSRLPAKPAVPLE